VGTVYLRRFKYNILKKSFPYLLTFGCGQLIGNVTFPINNSNLLTKIIISGFYYFCAGYEEETVTP